MDHKQAEQLGQALDQMTEAVRQIGDVFRKMAETSRAATTRIDALLEDTKQIKANLQRTDLRFAAIDEVYGVGGSTRTGSCGSEISYIYDSGVIVACRRVELPGVTPGEIVELRGQRLMVTELAGQFVFFESVDSEG